MKVSKQPAPKVSINIKTPSPNDKKMKSKIDNKWLMMYELLFDNDEKKLLIFYYILNK